MGLVKLLRKEIILPLLFSTFLIPSSVNTEKYTPNHAVIKNNNKIEKLRETPRIIKINVALDGVSKRYSEEIINYVSELYTKEFNISFEVVDFYKYNLPDEWRTDVEMEKIKNSFKKDSDIYLLFSGTDWDNKNDSGNYSVFGEAHESLGYVWIETHNEKTDKSNISHEIGHLFGLDHDDSEDSFMHRKIVGKVYFTDKMKKEILENKFKRWKFSEDNLGG
ncbi:MAG: zinc-dependent metalloprotease family protein [Nanoarchaeota archaeon]